MQLLLVDQGCYLHYQRCAVLKWYISNIDPSCNVNTQIWGDIELYTDMLVKTFHQKIEKWISVFTKNNKSPLHVAICYDDHSIDYWRETYQKEKKPLKPYKGNRKDLSNFKKCFIILHRALKDTISKLKESYTVTAIKIPGVEADDIIAVLAKRLQSHFDAIGIASNDGDLKQIPNVYMISMNGKVEYIDETMAKYYKMKKVILGDASDNILPTSKSKTSLHLLEERNYTGLMDFVRQNQKRMERYEYADMMINFDNIPKEVADCIYNAYLPSFTFESECLLDIAKEVIKILDPRTLNFIENKKVGMMGTHVDLIGNANYIIINKRADIKKKQLYMKRLSKEGYECTCIVIQASTEEPILVKHAIRCTVDYTLKTCKILL